MIKGSDKDNDNNNGRHHNTTKTKNNCTKQNNGQDHNKNKNQNENKSNDKNEHTGKSNNHNKNVNQTKNEDTAWVANLACCCYGACDKIAVVPQSYTCEAGEPVCAFAADFYLGGTPPLILHVFFTLFLFLLFYVFAFSL